MATRRQSFSVSNESYADLLPIRRASQVTATGLRQDWNDFRTPPNGMDSIITTATYANTPSYRDDPLDNGGKYIGGENKENRLDFRAPFSAGLESKFPFKLTRFKRSWEKIMFGLILITVLVVITKPHTRLRRVNHFNFGNDPSRPMRHTTPLPSFRDNLRGDLGYVTSFPYGGLTNQLIEVFKLVHLGHRLDRVAILPDLSGSTHREGTTIPLSNFFDLKGFSAHSNVSIIQWSELKMSPLTTKKWNQVKPEMLGCWGWDRPGESWSPLESYKVKVGFWPPPGQLTVPAFYSSSFSYPSIEVLASSDQRPYLDQLPGNLVPRIPRPVTNELIIAPKPEDQLLCFSNLFYVPASRFLKGSTKSRYTIEEFAPNDPVWSEVGKYLHFNDKSNAIATEILQYFYHLQTGSNYYAPSTRSATRTFELDSDPAAETRKRAELGTRFIGVHLRQGDFLEEGRASFTTLDYQNLVELLKIRLYKLLHPQGTIAKKVKSFGLGSEKNYDYAEDLPVLFVTDSSDPIFIQSIRKLGWIFIDHEKFRTLKKMQQREARDGSVEGEGWWTGIIDSIILSRGIGLVGTKQSTFSYVSARRVESWSGGLALIVGDDVPLLASAKAVTEERVHRKSKSNKPS